jgi:hypothetical protein
VFYRDAAPLALESGATLVGDLGAFCEAWGRAQKIVRRAAINRNSSVAAVRGRARKPAKYQYFLFALFASFCGQVSTVLFPAGLIWKTGGNLKGVSRKNAHKPQKKEGANRNCQRGGFLTPALLVGREGGSSCAAGGGAGAGRLPFRE